MDYLKNMISEVEDAITRKALLQICEVLDTKSSTEPANLKFAKVRPEAIIPTKRVEDAGYDMYACVTEDAIRILPNETVLVPTGIATCFSSKYMYKLMERSSTGTKGMGQRCGVIDSGYRNEILAPITNHSDKTLIITKFVDKDDNLIPISELPKIITIRCGKKGQDVKTISQNQYLDFVENSDSVLLYPMSKAITQGVLLYIPEVESEEISYEELQAIPSERGMNAWGSTKK